MGRRTLGRWGWMWTALAAATAACGPAPAGGEIDLGGAARRPPRAGTAAAAFPIDPLTELPIAPVHGREGAPARGPEGAPLLLVVFTDFECPFCLRHARMLNELVDRYGDRLRLVIRHYPLSFHPLAHAAAEATLAAQAEGRFWEYHDCLIEPGRGPLSEEVLEACAAAAGLDPERFRSALLTGRFAGAVDQDLRDGLAAGVEGTPATFINGRFVSGAQPLDDFVEICDALLEDAR